MMRLALLVALLICSLWQPASQAASIKIDEQAREQITLTVDSANVAQVLDDMGKRYGFKVIGLSNVTAREPLKATISGSLEDVLGRLLRNWNHMIVRSPDNERGIQKVMILDSSYGSVPASANKNTRRNPLTKFLQRRLSSAREN